MSRVFELMSQLRRRGALLLAAAVGVLLAGCDPERPRIDSITPDGGTAGTTVNLTIIGERFDATSTGGVTEIRIVDPVTSAVVTADKVAVVSTTIVGATRFEATLELAAGSGTQSYLVFLQPGNEYHLRSNAETFYVRDPAHPEVPRLHTINGYDMPAFTAEATHPIVLEGEFFEAPVSVIVDGTAVTVTDVVVESFTRITANLTIGSTGGPVGFRGLHVQTAGGASGALRIVILAPSRGLPEIKMVAPNFLTQNRSGRVGIYGARLLAGAEVLTDAGLTTPAGSALSVTDQRSASIELLGATTGVFDINVWTLPGESNSGHVHVVAPGTSTPRLTGVAATPGVRSPLLPGTTVAVLLRGTSFGPGGLAGLEAEAALAPTAVFLPAIEDSQRQGVGFITVDPAAAPGDYFLAVKRSDELVTNALSLLVNEDSFLPHLRKITPDRFKRSSTDPLVYPFAMDVGNVDPGTPVTIRTTDPTRFTAVGALSADGTKINGELTVTHGERKTGDVLTNIYVVTPRGRSNPIAFEIY